MRLNNSYKEIEKVKESIINYILIIGSLVAGVAYLVSLVQIPRTGYQFMYLIDAIATIIIGLTAIYRKKINVKYKSTAIIIAVTIFIFAVLLPFLWIKSCYAYLLFYFSYNPQ